MATGAPHGVSTADSVWSAKHCADNPELSFVMHRLGRALIGQGCGTPAGIGPALWPWRSRPATVLSGLGAPARAELVRVDAWLADHVV